MHNFFSARLGVGCLAVAAVLSLTPSWATPVRAPGPDFPQFASAEALKAACDSNLVRASLQLHQIERRVADGQWLAAYDAFSASLEDLSSNLLFLSAVHPDKSMRDAAEACELRWNDFNSSLGQNEKIYRAARAIKPRDAADRLLQKTLIEGFDDAGVGLAPAQRARAKRLTDRIAELGQTFERNIRDANVRLAFSEDELQGVPAGVWDKAKRDAQGRVLLGLDYPTYVPVMQSAELAATRERMWRAKTNEGGEANLKLLAEITRLRKDYASLLGAASWDEFVLRRRMAETPAMAVAFLDEVKAAVQQRERTELEELHQAKAAHLMMAPETVKLERWDVNFYTERVRRERYAVDQEAFRAYFPPQASLQFALRLIERLMGVRYQRIEGAPAWHPEVQTYAVSDAASGKPLATLWVDLYPREGKYNHAAVWGLRSASLALKRVSQAALVVNFDRLGLTLDELETLLHELGHAVHNNLSATRRAQQAGTSVMRDFVEAPSQMLEDWVLDKRVLKLFAEVCPSCTPVPDALMDQAVAASHYGKGVRASRQHLYASYDLALYGPELHDPMALWAQMEGDTLLGHVPGTMFPAGFAHIAGGYSAGYYGYLWSLVVAMDLRTAFAADKLDPAVGKRYRDLILANGSQRLPQALVHDFFGRDFNAKAFFDDLKR
jgi:thimet oligopeptidase